MSQFSQPLWTEVNRAEAEGVFSTEHLGCYRGLREQIRETCVKPARPCTFPSATAAETECAAAIWALDYFREASRTRAEQTIGYKDYASNKNIHPTCSQHTALPVRKQPAVTYKGTHPEMTTQYLNISS